MKTMTTIGVAESSTIADSTSVLRDLDGLLRGQNIQNLCKETGMKNYPDLESLCSLLSRSSYLSFTCL